MTNRRNIETEMNVDHSVTSIWEAINYQPDPVVLLERLQENILIVTEANNAFLDLVHNSRNLIIGQNLDDVFYQCDELWLKKVKNLSENSSSDSFQAYSKVLNTHLEIRQSFLGDGRFYIQLRDISDYIEQQQRNERLTNLYRSLRDISRLTRLCTDKEAILSEAANILVKNQGYYSVTIVLMDTSGDILEKFFAFSEEEKEDFKTADLSKLPCLDKISKGQDLLYTLNPFEECTGCPFLETYQNRSAIVSALKYKDMNYGAIIASGDIKESESTEEKDLFLEIAGKLALAIFSSTRHSPTGDEDRKAYYEQLARQNKQLLELNQQLEALSQELLTAKQKAEESEKVKSNFLGLMSHEIRTPLNGIIGFAQLLRRNSLEPSKIQEYLHIICDSGTNLLKTLNNVLDFSKLESTKIEVHSNTLHPETLCRELFAEYALELKNKDKKEVEIYYECSLNESEQEIRLDSIKVHQIMRILLDNAVKFTDKGRIDFGIKSEEDQLVFYVKDTGIGIPHDKFELIFERFRQVDSSSTRPYGGAGLGLAIAKALAERMNGRILVESEINAGSLFQLFIPVSISDLDKESSDFVAQSPNKKVLVVEDDTYSAEYIMEVLEDMDKTAYWVKSGKEAIAYCKNKSDIGLVLMDIQLPGVSGEQATREIRKFNTSLPIIAQTANAMIKDREKYLAAGCDDYLPKPIAFVDLRNIIQKYL